MNPFYGNYTVTSLLENVATFLGSISSSIVKLCFSTNDSILKPFS